MRWLVYHREVPWKESAISPVILGAHFDDQQWIGSLGVYVDIRIVVRKVNGVFKDLLTPVTCRQ